jgi:hypothetical protein
LHEIHPAGGGFRPNATTRDREIRSESCAGGAGHAFPKNFVIREGGRIRVKVLRGEDEIRLGSLFIFLAPKEAAN